MDGNFSKAEKDMNIGVNPAVEIAPGNYTPRGNCSST